MNPATTNVLLSLGLPPDPSVFLPGDFDKVVPLGAATAPVRACRVVQIRERYFHESICMVPGQTSVRVYAYDITDRVHATEALSYANHKLGILTSITRHDIQNKLSGVFGYLDLLRGSLRDPQLIGIPRQGGDIGRGNPPPYRFHPGLRIPRRNRTGLAGDPPHPC